MNTNQNEKVLIFTQFPSSWIKHSHQESVASFRFPFDINIWRVSHCKTRGHHKFTRDRVSRPRASVKSVSEPRTVVTSICDTLASKSIFIQFQSPCSKYTHTFCSLSLLTAARIQSKSARTCVRRQVTRRKESTATDMSSGLDATIAIVGFPYIKLANSAIAFIF